MTPTLCSSLCTSAGYTFAGIEYGDEVSLESSRETETPTDIWAVLLREHACFHDDHAQLGLQHAVRG
jgi:hypothetical protein